MAGDDDRLQHQIDELRHRIVAMLYEASGEETKTLLPTLSWVSSIEKKLYQGRLLTSEAESINIMKEIIDSSVARKINLNVSPIERLSLDMLERYEGNTPLRMNWEARCAIGNLLTISISENTNNTATLISAALRTSESSKNWDLAQMLFDALHHAKTINTQGREFLMTTAVQHGHEQVRWNVAAALKSIPVSEQDLQQIIKQLLRDPSPWVVKELIEVGLRNSTILSELAEPTNRSYVFEAISRDPSLLEHTSLTLNTLYWPYSSIPTLSRSLKNFIMHENTKGFQNRVVPSNYNRKILEEDFNKVAGLRAKLQGQHGKLYTAAERVVFARIESSSTEAQQTAIITYLHSTHDALAWASVRALFSGKLRRHEDEFYHQALAAMLTHHSEWIRRECVEETLRLKAGRLKYIALRQIEIHKDLLANIDEIRPYLEKIGMDIEE